MRSYRVLMHHSLSLMLITQPVEWSRYKRPPVECPSCLLLQTLYLVPMIWAAAGRFCDAGEVANPPPMHDLVILRLVKETGITVEQARDLINLLGNLNWDSLLREARFLTSAAEAIGTQSRILKY
ncbi:hypothetical protein [Mesorhizobium sp. M0207]|uniref:hypothetical protein n=1 Tax=unclassified Mesorhizobium TaxID=325217 RepID=UPI0033399A31